MNLLRTLLPLFLVFTTFLDADTIRLKSGKEFQGRILRLEAERLHYRVEISNGHAEMSTSLVDLESIEFDPSELSRLTSETPLSEFRAAWIRQKPFLALTGSDAAEVGLRLCQQLLLLRRTNEAREALEILPLIERHAPLPQARTEALVFRLEALVLCDRITEASTLAQTHRDSTDPLLRTAAQFTQGLIAADQLYALQKSHPRWSEVSTLKRQHRKLLGEALDAFLYPVVFYPNQKSACARALWQVAELYRRTGQPDSARIAARELLQEFPDPRYQPQAERLLKQLEPST